MDTYEKWFDKMEAEKKLVEAEDSKNKLSDKTERVTSPSDKILDEIKSPDKPEVKKILTDEDADVVLLGRELLRNPYWPLQARYELDGENNWPSQYARVGEIRQYI